LMTMAIYQILRVHLFVVGERAPQWARASSFTRFLDHTQSVGLLWTSDQLVVETTHTTLTTDKLPCARWDSKPQISSGERPQTYALERAATGTGTEGKFVVNYKPFQLF
jgi:hypothetical protein